MVDYLRLIRATSDRWERDQSESNAMKVKEGTMEVDIAIHDK